MLQKPDFSKIDITDEDAITRLVKVWEIIEANSWLPKKVKIVAKLTREIPENKGNVSAFLGGKRPMSTNFYDKFLEKYAPTKLPTTKTTKKTMEENPISPPEGLNLQRILDDNHTLIETQRRAVENERIALENNSKSIDLSRQLAESNMQMLKQIQSTGNAPKGTGLNDSAMLQGIRELLIEVATGKQFESAEEVVTRLNKAVSAVAKGGPLNHTQNDSGR